VKSKLLSVLAVLFLCSEVVAQETQTFEFTSYLELEELFAEIGYTRENWQKGVKEVPRLYLANIPERWRSTTSKTVTVQKKKELFFRLLGPLALRANELILAEREWLIDQRSAGPDKAPSENLRSMYENYRVEPGDFDQLLERVDMVPPSLILAQAAEESGWGTSRFAALGNALFGQWTYGKGIAPLQRRQEKGNYSIAAFDTPLDSVRAYMRNINSHPAYRDLRDKRAAVRKDGGSVTGHELAKTLTKYSERGEDYVHSLHAIMRVNKLGPTDQAHLAAGAAVELMPVEVKQ
jgi:Bax protein